MSKSENIIGRQDKTMKKSLSDYEASILQYHVELQRLPEYHPDHEKKQDQLSRQLTAWSKKLNITVQVASNEKTDWQSEELGYLYTPMVTKQASGQRQVADYHAYLEDYNHLCGLCVERKGTTRENGRMVGCDLYSSFSKKDNRRRFEAEFKRYQKDPRFNLFVLIAECSCGEYLSFKPAFNGKNYNKTNFGMSIAARRATLAKLIAMGVVVQFAGTRKAAVELYHDLVLQWCRVNYKAILGIEDYPVSEIGTQKKMVMR